jgi:hypothetical protein
MSYTPDVGFEVDMDESRSPDLEHSTQTRVNYKEDPNLASETSITAKTDFPDEVRLYIPKSSALNLQFTASFYDRFNISGSC